MKEKKEEEEKEGTKNWNIYINNNFGKKLENIPQITYQTFSRFIFYIHLNWIHRTKIFEIYSFRYEDIRQFYAYSNNNK